MKITLEAATLLAGINRVQKIVEKRSTIPILANVMLTAGKNVLTLRATDLDIQVDTEIAAEVEKAGSITVSAHMLYAIVRKLPKAGTVVIEGADKDNALINLRCGRSIFKLQTLPSSDFPDLAARPAVNTFTVTGAELTRLLSKVAFCISSEETRYYLNGIYLHEAPGQANDRKLRAVATDGHKLGWLDIALPAGAEKLAGSIIPRKTAAEALALCEKVDTVGIEMAEGRITFDFGHTTLTSKLIDGTFPDYMRVIPTGNDKIVVCARKDLGDTADRVSTVSSERGRAVKMSFTNSKLELSVINPDTGSAQEEIEIEFDNDPLDIGFNARYLAEILGNAEGDTVEIKLNDPGSPTLFGAPGDPSMGFVLMPMRV